MYCKSCTIFLFSRRRIYFVMSVTDMDSERREFRRKRRVRNQALAYISLLLFVAVLAAGTMYLVHRSVNGTTGNDRNIAEAGKDLPEQEETPPLVIEEPDSPDDYPVTDELSPEEQLLNEMIDSHIGQMTLQEKVAGLFVITPEQLTGVGTVTAAGQTTKEALEAKPVGGLIYFAKNIRGYDKFKEMLTNTVAYSKYPLFLCVDEEGGQISRVANALPEVEGIDSPAVIAQGGEPANAYEAYARVAAYLNDVGINVDFAPVADVKTDVNTLFDLRSFGTDPAAVSEFVSQAVLGLEDSEVSACLKHFPGHGATEGDSETGIAVTERTPEEMQNGEFLPFIAGIESGVDFVMVGHISVPQINGDYVPASMSRRVMTDILRNELGYEGIIITDAMNMKAITDYYPAGEAAVSAVKAGADMILMPEKYQEAFDAVLDAVANGEIPEERIDESLRRICRVKCEKMVVTSYDDIGNDSE